MDFKQVIEASATIIRITELRKNDVVKIIDEDNNDAKLSYGVVEDVLNDGTKGFVQLNVIKKDYYGCNMERRVLSQDAAKQPALFPAVPDEIKEYFDAVRENLCRRLKDAEKSVIDAQERLAAFDKMRADESTFSSPKYAQ